MLRFTRRSEYGMMALVFLARSRKGCCSVREIHGELGVPRRLLAEVLKALCKVEIVEGIRGPGGGYRLREDPYSIPLSRVVEALDGNLRITECSKGGDCRWLEDCSIRGGMTQVAARIHGVLDDFTVAEVAFRIRQGKGPEEV